jgi:hypothetical protein
MVPILQKKLEVTQKIQVLLDQKSCGQNFSSLGTKKCLLLHCLYNSIDEGARSSTKTWVELC